MFNVSYFSFGRQQNNLWGSLLVAIRCKILFIRQVLFIIVYRTYISGKSVG